MRTIYTLSSLLLALSLLAVSGCQSEQEDVMERSIDLINEAADKMAEIKTNTDVIDAKPDLEKIGAKMADHEKVMSKLPTPTGDEQAELQKEYKPKLERAMARLQDEMKRIGQSAGPEAAFTVMQTLKMDPTMGMD